MIISRGCRADGASFKALEQLLAFKAAVLALGGGSVALEMVVLMSRDAAAARDGVMVVA